MSDPQSLEDPVSLSLAVIASPTSLPDEKARAATALFLTLEAPSGTEKVHELYFAGALHHLLEMIKLEENDVNGGRAIAADALRVMVRDGAMKAKVIELGGLETVVALVESGPDEAATAACKVLFNISNVIVNKRSVIDAGAVPPLVALLQEGSPGAKIEAIDVLYLLVSVQGGLGDLAIGILAHVIKFVRDNPETNFVRTFSLICALGGEQVITGGPKELFEAVQTIGLEDLGPAAWSEQTADYLDEWLACNGQMMVKSAGKR